jgi:enoyl-CoA hydratase/carnithine racemase
MNDSLVTRRVGVDGGVMQCTISSAPSGALSMSAVAELDAALTSLDPNTRVVVLFGDAGQFCRGGDVAAFADADRPDELVADMAAALKRLVERFAACRGLGDLRSVRAVRDCLREHRVHP